jgi:PadR family transcriptional regulator PadR
MRSKKTNPDFLNGVPELLILKLLSERPMYGYELVQALREVTGGAFDFGEGCVYPILHRLEAENVLKSQRQAVGRRSRVVYRATPQVEKRLAHSIASWKAIAQTITRALEGGHVPIQVA